MTLEISGLEKRFGGLRALRGLDLAAQAGQVTALIGPNGAGKTTALNVVSGVLSATAGRVHLDGQDVSGRRANELAAAGLARTYQNLQVFAGMSVLEMTMVGAHRAGRAGWVAALLRLPSAWREEAALEARARAALARVGLDGSLFERDASTLAYGLQRRVEIARALAGDPKYLLLDEPAAGLNPRETEEMSRLVVRLKDDGLGIVLVEHDMGMVMSVSDRVAVMNFGERIAEGTPAEVQREPAVLEAYLGKGFGEPRRAPEREAVDA